MIYSVSLTINHGLNVSLTVQADDPFFQRIFSGSGHGFSTEALELSLRKALAGMPTVLQQAHDSVYQNLLRAACDVLEKKD